MTDYNDFPFGIYSITEIAQMFIDSTKVNDVEFADACRKEIQRRPATTEKGKDVRESKQWDGETLLGFPIVWKDGEELKEWWESIQNKERRNKNG